MSFVFERHEGLILVNAIIEGPTDIAALRLALDTGASHSLVAPRLLQAVGYQYAVGGKQVQITTGSGVEYAARVVIRKLTALGQERRDLRVVCHALPATTEIDGLLGRDFMRDLQLTVDFREGTISLH